MSDVFVLDVAELVDMSEADFRTYGKQLNEVLASKVEEWQAYMNDTQRSVNSDGSPYPGYAEAKQGLDKLNQETRQQLYQPFEAFYSAYGIRQWRRSWDLQPGREDDHLIQTSQDLSYILYEKTGNI